MNSQYRWHTSSTFCLTATHYGDVIMGMMVSQIPSLIIVYSTVYSGADQRKHQSSASLPFVRRIHRGPVNSLQKWSVTRKMFPFDDVIVELRTQHNQLNLHKWKQIRNKCRVATGENDVYVGYKVSAPFCLFFYINDSCDVYICSMTSWAWNTYQWNMIVHVSGTWHALFKPI